MAIAAGAVEYRPVKNLRVARPIVDARREFNFAETFTCQTALSGYKKR